ncbi:bifunctional aminotransferase class I/II-fold pyridoxal phosphate-dependent enzyme/GNAT family N-acetyltransferase [Marinoscillum sp. MHG1-6]|uniref:bifunctional aminotransferase class I/II-fold pyridoxal phosphate-dependent enzyme/GNAT family N-acetyltransferase n=1 Tax=Marinoscillum sp. MHG1-6 TaxID=2959627 RepID=UPI0021579DC5|nr:bifunctional aminotransferase class I/II-fold pyridoxal phosphate-dependent enzyme/GNAT family N-acetyltransferase [Marinoscillum sp. MHG1-6]
MAKIIHNNILDTVDAVFTVSKNKGSLHLYAEDDTLDGRHLTINGRKVLHFGTCGYLGLEHHPKLKQGAIDAIMKYGTQFPMSRTFVSNPLYNELHDRIQEMYKAPVVVSKNCTLSHLTTIPILITQEDLVVMDHLVHTSVQEAVKKMLSQGVTVEMIRHNNLEMLEAIIKKNRSKYSRIWYMADGVYSMYGDYAPIKEMIALAEKYEQLYLYVDDAHGTSWAGKHGTGYVMSQMDGLYRKMILTANLGKAFGACGGLTVFPDEELHRKVNIFGGPLSFSVQIEPATLGAAIASADIHLSDEIYKMQESLLDKIMHFNKLLRGTDLPLIVENDSPIFFIGVGTMDMGNYIVREMVKDGVYVNIGPYPAVPAKNIGIRVTISQHNTKEDIEELVRKLDVHFHKALVATNQTLLNIKKAFKLPIDNETKEAGPVIRHDRSFQVSLFDSIKQIDPSEWDDHLGKRGMFDWNGLSLLERSFINNEEEANNWKFRYMVCRDQNGQILLMTFFISALYKEDIFSRASISIALEKERTINPNYLISRGIFIGSLFTEGNHLFLDRDNPDWKPAMKSLIDELYRFQEEEDASNIMFRDLEVGDSEFEEYMIEHGFVRVDLPESCVVENLSWDTEEEFVQGMTPETKKNFRRYIKRYEHLCDVEFRDKLSEEELQHALKLHEAVNRKNMAINTFLFPERVFREMVDDPMWEFVQVKIKPQFNDTDEAIVVCFCQKNSRGVYSFMLTAIDYDRVYDYSGYRLALWAMVKRARELKCHQANFGISATVEKKRVGARPHPRVGYYQAKDNYAMEMMETTIAKEKD